MLLKLKKARGCLVLDVPRDLIAPYLDGIDIPESYLRNRVQRDDSNDYHVTIISPEEASGDGNIIERGLAHTTTLDSSTLFILGCGKFQQSDNEVYYLVVHHPDINAIRKSANVKLQPTFHITLGFKFNDIHGVEKGLKTIMQPNVTHFESTNVHHINNFIVLEYIHNHIGPIDKFVVMQAKKILNNFNDAIKKHMSDEMVDLDTSMQECLEQLMKTPNYIAYVIEYMYKSIKSKISVGNGAVEDETAIESLHRAVSLYSNETRLHYDVDNHFLFKLQQLYNHYSMSLVIHSNGDRRKLCILMEPEGKKSDINILMHEMPRNFCWVIPNRLAGISKLRSSNDILGLQAIGINNAYYFLEKRYFDDIEVPPPSPLRSNQPWSLKYIPCENEKTPLLEDMYQALSVENFFDGENHIPASFGCLGGFGRTGTALACFLVQYGLAPLKSYAPYQAPAMSPNEAVSYLRSIRPKSIENAIQLSYVHQYCNYLYSKMEFGEDGGVTGKNVKPTKKQTTKIKFIMLVGLPASGKSTFCELFTSCDLKCILLNQDQLGRNECESSLLSSLKACDIVLLDRTNLTANDRKYWLELSLLKKEECLCICLTTPAFICKERAKVRINHPTIKTGGGGRIIADAERQFELPVASEGFSDVIYLEDSEDVRNYLKTWNCSQIELRNELINANTMTNASTINNATSAAGSNCNPHRIELIKFPRTQHLINLGSASRDDLLIANCDDVIKNVELEITEKVDGAQLGFSIDPANFKIRAQNRSHYVNSKSHSQFQHLDKFISAHQESLYEILNDSDHILFGEWLYAKHSVGYNKLPSLFLAFDLYNINTKQFYAREIVESKLAGSSLNMVPLLFKGVLTNGRAQLLAMLERKSNFSDDNRLEGIYLKQNGMVDGVKVVTHRSKIVRSDFICGDTHWNKYNVESNTVVHRDHY